RRARRRVSQGQAMGRSGRGSEAVRNGRRHMAMCAMISISFAPIAMAQDKVWDDATVLRVGGDNNELEKVLDDAIFAAPELHGNLKRVGLVKTCSIAKEAR